MRLFQNSGLYPGYLPRLAKLTKNCQNFTESRDIFLSDRYGACHFLEPVLKSDPNAFFTNGDDQSLQKLWAAEHGMPASVSLEEILLAQIEDHKADVFYNLDPMRYSSAFVHRLPGCVKASIAWRAAPSPNADFSAYDLVVCNFPSILEGYKMSGWRGAYFSPAHDPVMDKYSKNANRMVDILFVGGYSRHHKKRAELLDYVAKSCSDLNIEFHLDRSRLTKIAESTFGSLMPFGKHRRPKAIRKVSFDPLFGLDLYDAISNAKIVLNGAVDMAGNDRGNMRCFEALGCGAALLSDEGNYPADMVDGVNMVAYKDSVSAVRSIRELVSNPARLISISKNGHEMIAERYGKANQWLEFQRLVENI